MTVGSMVCKWDYELKVVDLWENNAVALDLEYYWTIPYLPMGSIMTNWWFLRMERMKDGLVVSRIID